SQLLVSREKSCLSRLALEHHAKGVMAKLTRQAMSGDETDPETPGPPKGFRSRPIDWRSDALVNFLHTLDDIYRANWRSPVGKRATGGNPPRLRFHTGNLDPVQGIAPPGLERNFYNPAFIASLRSWQLRDLQIVDKDYDFSIPESEL
ncbi:hypothetical protein BV25DRAFT_1815909, partial [Artomyces pyxidatus]